MRDFDIRLHLEGVESGSFEQAMVLGASVARNVVDVEGSGQGENAQPRVNAPRQLGRRQARVRQRKA